MDIITADNSAVFPACIDSDTSGYFGGKLAESLGLTTKPVCAGDAVARFRVTGTGSVAAYHLTFAAPSDWSRRYAAAPPDAATAMDLEFSAAVGRTLGEAESALGFTRRGDGKVRRIRATGLVWARFDCADRADRHTHVLIGTKVSGADGKWGDLDLAVEPDPDRTLTELFHSRLPA